MNIVLAWADAATMLNLFTNQLNYIKISGISIMGFFLLLIITKWLLTILVGNGSSTGSGTDDGGKDE